MHSTFSFPFRVFSNNNLGTTFDYSTYTGELIASEGTGQYKTLPEVNLATGNLHLKSTLVKTQETIGNWEFGFVFNAQSETPWTYNIPEMISSDASQLVMKEEDGSRVTYLWDENQKCYLSPAGSHSRFMVFVNPDGTFTRLDPKTGTKSFFGTDKKINSVVDTRGFSMQYHYEGSELTQITSDAGTYSIDKNDGVVTVSFLEKDESQKEILGSWSLDANNQVQSATLPNQYTINYKYDDENHLTKVSQTDGTSLNFTYTKDATPKVQTLQQGTQNQTYTFSYSDITTITDAAGFTTTAHFDESQRILDLDQLYGDDPASSKTLTTSCNYLDNGDFTRFILPCGSATTFEINPQGLITKKISTIDQTTKFEYDPTTFALIQQQDLYTGDRAPYYVSSYLVYQTDAKKNLLRFTVSPLAPTGAVTEYRYTESGALESKRVYLKSRYSHDESGMPSLENLTAWCAKQQPDQISLTTYSENNRGQVTEKQIFTQVDAQGNGIESKDASHDLYEYTKFGAITKHTQKVVFGANDEVTNAITQSTFDCLGRLRSETDALENAKIFDYNDSSRQLVITMPNGRLKTQTWNDAGQLTEADTTVSSFKRTEKREYNSKLKTIHIQKEEQSSYQLYDNLGRLRFSITPEGRVTETIYDDNHRFKSTKYYYNVLSADILQIPLSIQTVKAALKENDQDKTTYQLFDICGRLQYEVDGRGALVEHRYDDQNREIIKINYVDLITPDDVSGLINGESRTLKDTDIVNTTFYDYDGNIIATQDGMGYVTQHIRNSAGFEIQRIQFATPVPRNLTKNLQLPIYSINDFTQYFFCDARGQTLLTVDDDLTAFQDYVTQQTYTPNGQVLLTKRFANTADNAPEDAKSMADLIPRPDSEDQITHHEYDLLHRVIKTHLPQQRLESVSYDAMGNITLHSAGDDPSSNNFVTTQSTANQHDGWDQKVAQASPLVYALIDQINKDNTLTPQEKTAKINDVYKNHAEQFIHDDQTGLLIQKIGIRPLDAPDSFKPITYYYYDKDRRLVLTVGPLGEVTQKTWHPIANQPTQIRRYSKPISIDALTGGFITPDIEKLLITSDDDVIETFEYDQMGAQTKHIDGDGFETQTHFNAMGLWDKKVLPVTDTKPSLLVTRTFNARSQSVTETKTADNKSITTQKRFDNLHGHCTESIDELNASTQYTYEPRGVVSTIINPLKQTTHLMHDAFEREVQHSLPDTQTIRHDFNQETRRVEIITFGVHNSGMQTVQLKFNDAFGNVIQTEDANGKTETQYTLDNQWQKITDANGNTQIRVFDLRGLPTSSTYTNATSGYTSQTDSQYDVNKHLTLETQDASHLNLQSEIEWNTLHQRVHETDQSNGNTRQLTYNKRNLVEQHQRLIDGTHAVITEQSYNGQEQTSLLSHHTSSQTSIYQESLGTDGFGRVTQTITDPNGLKITKTQEYDNANRVTLQKDANGFTTYFVHDALGNVRFEINAKGGVTEHRYNAANKVIFTAQYHVAIDTASVTQFTEDSISKLISKTDQDRLTYFFYDDLMNERFRVNGLGCVVESRFDANNHKIADIQYYAAIQLSGSDTTDSINQQCQKIKDDKNDRVVYRVLDALSQEAFIIHGDGTVIEKQYQSSAHRVNAEIHYATKVSDPASIALLSIDEIKQKITQSPDDRQTLWITDALDRVQYHVTPKGFVTQFTYNGSSSDPLTIVQFADPITLSDYQTNLKTLSALVVDKDKDSIEEHEYDGAGREIRRTNPLKFSEYFTYDGAGRKSSHTDVNGYEWIYKYDDASRLAYEYSPTTTVFTTKFDEATHKLVTTSEKASVIKKTEHDANGNVTSVGIGVGDQDKAVTDIAFDTKVSYFYDELNAKKEEDYLNLAIDDPSKTTSLTVRPETTQTVSKKTVYGAHGSKLVEINESGNPCFYVHNAQGQIQYKVNAKGYVIEFVRNAFGDCESIIRYATPISITSETKGEDFKSTGMTQEHIKKHLSTSNDDRQTQHTFDQFGKLIYFKRDEVVCYVPDPDPTKPPSVSLQSPEKSFVYNAFHEEVSVTTKVDKDVLRKVYTWHDKAGNEIAKVDSNGVDVVKAYDSHNKEIQKYEYAKKLDVTLLNDHLSYDDLTALLSKISDGTHDHYTTTERDKMGNETCVTQIGLITQTIQGQNFVDNPPADIKVTINRTPDGKVKYITYPDGQVKIYYYDERGNKAAMADVVRTQPDGTKIRPITFYHYSADNDLIETYEPIAGPVDLDPTSNTLPVPQDHPDQDKYTRVLFDSRHKVLAKQDAENNVQEMTLSATGKIIRHYHALTNATKDSTVVELHETKKTYDELDRLTQKENRRDAKKVDDTFYDYDAFNLTAEGPDGTTWPKQYRFDKAGRKWLHTNDKGSSVITGHNAAGESTVSVEAFPVSKDLSSKTYADLIPLFSTHREDPDTILDLDFTETIRDPMGRPCAFIEPGYMEEVPDSKTAKESENLKITKQVHTRPVHQIKLDNFNKKVETITPKGESTTFERNKQNKITKQTEPEIPVTDEHGVDTTQAGVTEFGYNAQAAYIGTRDANDHVELLKLDEADQEVTRIAGDGTPYYTKTLNNFGYNVATKSASGNTWRKEVNRKGKVTALIMPSGDKWQYTLNEDGFKIIDTPPTGSARGEMRYAQDFYGNTEAQYYPMGEEHKYTFDRNRQVLMHTAVNTDGSVAYRTVSERDYFGKETKYTDGSGSVYQSDYYANGLLHKRYGVSIQDHGDMAVFDSTTNSFPGTTVPVPLQDLTYNYLTARRQSSIVDANTVSPQNLTRLFDINGKPLLVVETNKDGNELRHTAMTFNARGWPLTQTDVGGFSLNTFYDPVGNRRRMNAVYCSIKHDGWWSYDSADRVLVDDGVLMNGVIQNYIEPLSDRNYWYPNFQGHRFSYSDGLQISQVPSETFYIGPDIFLETKIVPVTYDVNERIKSFTFQPPMYMPNYAMVKNFVYSNDSILIKVLFNSNKTTLYFSTFDLNGRLLTSSHPGWGSLTTTRNNSFNADNIPINFTVLSEVSGNTTKDVYNNKFSLFDQFVIASVTLARTNQNVTNSTTSFRFYNPNNSLNKMSNINNPYDFRDHASYDIYFETSLDRKILKTYLVLAKQHTCENLNTVFFHDSQGHIICEYEPVLWGHIDKGIRKVLKMTANPVCPLRLLDSMQTPSVNILPGDNWDSISTRAFGDPTYGSILNAYSGNTLISGQTIDIPRTIQNYNKSCDYTPYEKIIASLYNNLNPWVKTPQPKLPSQHHHQWWETLIEVVASVITMIVIPYIAAPAIFGVLGTIGTAVAFGVAGALASAETQGLAMAFGDQQSFSLENMFGNAITSGLTAGFMKGLGITELFASENSLQAIEGFTATVSLGLTIQAFELAAGFIDKLDIKSILEQAAAQLLQSRLSLELKPASGAETNALDETANAAVHFAAGDNVDATALLGNYLGDEAGDAAISSYNSADRKAASKSIGKGLSKPQTFAGSTRANHTAPSVVTQDLSLDDFRSDLYNDYRATLHGDVDFIAANNAVSAHHTVAKSVEDEIVHDVTGHQTTSGARSVGFFSRPLSDFYGAQRFMQGVVTGAKMVENFFGGANDAMESFKNDIAYDAFHPYRTAVALYTTVRDNEFARYHFALAMLRPSTRQQAYTQMLREYNHLEQNLHETWAQLTSPNLMTDARYAGRLAANFAPVLGGLGVRNVVRFFGRVAEGESAANYSFKAGEDVIHFSKHSQEMIDTFGYKNYSLQEYVKDANLVIKNGTYVPELNGYVAIAGGKGGAKGIFVGLDRMTNEITTLHLKPVSYFERKAPSLGWISKLKSELTDLIGPDHELGWKSPYRRNSP